MRPFSDLFLNLNKSCQHYHNSAIDVIHFLASWLVINDSSVGEWMYHTVCPPCGSAHDSSVGEWMYHTVCPPCGSGHDNSVGEWMYLTVCPLLGPVMKAQWENEWVSLSVLSVARVMIAQWDSSLSALPVAWVMIAQWESSLSVLPVARVMIAQWENESYCLRSLWPGLW